MLEGPGGIEELEAYKNFIRFLSPEVIKETLQEIREEAETLKDEESLHSAALFWIADLIETETRDDAPKTGDDRLD